MESQEDMLDFTNASCREVLVSCLVLLGGASKQCEENISVMRFCKNGVICLKDPNTSQKCQISTF